MISDLANSIKASSTLALSAKVNELRLQGVDVVEFGVGEPDFDTPNYINEAAKKAIDDGWSKYTNSSGILDLRRVICDKLQRENKIIYAPEQVVVSNGAKHSLTNAFLAILNPQDEVIIPAPYWLSYPEMVKIAGGVSKIVHTKKEDNFKLLPEQLQSAITNKTKAIILNSPSNPTGIVYNKEEMATICKIAVQNNLWIIADEIYEYLVDEDVEHISVASLSEEIYNHTITINGVSKSYAMTGWRIGYLAAPKEVAKAVGNIQSHMTSNPNAIAQVAAITAIASTKEDRKPMILEFSKRRSMMYKWLSEIDGFHVIKPSGAFYCFVDVSDLYGKSFEDSIINCASDFANLLLEKACVAVVPCEDFAAPDCIRLSYATNQVSTCTLTSYEHLVPPLVCNHQGCFVFSCSFHPAFLC